MSIEPEQLCDEVTLYEGDCLEVLPTLTGIDAIATDPPYGIDYGRSGDFSASHGWGPWRENVLWDRERPSREVFVAMLAIGVPTLIWGGNYFTDCLPPSMGWLSWDKGQRGFSLADFELAWSSENKAARCINLFRAVANREEKNHPTQKPVQVMIQSIQYLQRGRKKRLETILDPFAGSGTTAIAALREGRKCILIEKDPAYCEIIRRRVREAAGVGSLFEGVT